MFRKQIMQMDTFSNRRRGDAAYVVIVVILLIILGGLALGYYANRPRSADTRKESSAEKAGGLIVKKEKDSSALGQGGSAVKFLGAVLAGTSAPLIGYNKVDYDAAVKSDKLVALYFTANWCPICKVELPNLYAAWNELATDKVVGFRVDYNDSDTDADEKNLARELGVVYQHTKVFLKNGKQILKSPESWSKERNLSEINKAIAQ